MTLKISHTHNPSELRAVIDALLSCCFTALSSADGDSVVKFYQTIRATCVTDGIDNGMDFAKESEG